MVRNYTLLFDFNIRAITETAIYLVQLSYDGQRIGSFELYGQDTDNVNRWTPSDVYASMSFVPPPTSQMTTKMPPQLRIGIQQMGDDEEASLSLGLDAIRVVANR